MPLVRDNEYWFITDKEFDALYRLSRVNPDPDIFDDVYAAFVGHSVTYKGHNYFYALTSDVPPLTDEQSLDLYDAEITLDYHVFISMATLDLQYT